MPEETKLWHKLRPVLLDRGDGELHGDGHHDDDCDVCCAIKAIDSSIEGVKKNHSLTLPSDFACDAAGTAYFRYTFGADPEPSWLISSREAFREAIRAAIETLQ